MKKLNKKALVGLLSVGLLMTGVAGCQPKDELEEAATTQEPTVVVTEEVSSDVDEATPGKEEKEEKEEKLVDPSGYNAEEPKNPNLITEEEENGL